MNVIRHELTITVNRVESNDGGDSVEIKKLAQRVTYLKSVSEEEAENLIEKVIDSIIYSLC